MQLQVHIDACASSVGRLRPILKGDDKTSICLMVDDTNNLKRGIQSKEESSFDKQKKKNSDRFSLQNMHICYLSIKLHI